MNQLNNILKLIRPNCEYNVRGNIIEWLDKDQPQPTEEELRQGLLLVENFKYREYRQNEYPKIEDQLDALWKGEPYTTEMRDTILSIKQKYPKPNLGDK